MHRLYLKPPDPRARVRADGVCARSYAPKPLEALEKASLTQKVATQLLDPVKVHKFVTKINSFPSKEPMGKYTMDSFDV